MVLEIFATFYVFFSSPFQSTTRAIKLVNIKVLGRTPLGKIGKKYKGLDKVQTTLSLEVYFFTNTYMTETSGRGQG